MRKSRVRQERFAANFTITVHEATREELISEVIYLNKVLASVISEALDHDCARCSHNDRSYPAKRSWYQALTDGACGRTISPSRNGKDTGDPDEQ